MADYHSKKKKDKCKKHITYNSSDDYDDDFVSCYSYSDDNEEQVKEEENMFLLGLQNLSLIVPKKKKLLVFHLDGVLIYRHQPKKYPSPNDPCPDGVYRNQAVFKRPFLDELMRFCLQRFEVGIWSCTQVQNTDGVIGCAFQEFEKQFLFVWNQDECSNYRYNVPGIKKRKPIFFKELSQIWSSFGDHSSNGPRFSEANTLLIDDEPYKALLNPPNNGIFLETYNVKDATDNALDPKNELGVFLEGLAEATDVPSYVKSHPIGKPAIGPTDSNWAFYSRIRRRFCS